MSDMCDIYISEIRSLLRRADELITQGRTDNTCFSLYLWLIGSVFCEGMRETVE